MKKSILLFVPFLFVNFSFAQWTTSGSNIYNSNTGNVGIGTTIPISQLDVYNTSSITSGGHTGVHVLTEHTAATTGVVMGIQSETKMNYSTGTSPYCIAVAGTSFNTGSGTVNRMSGFQGTTVLSGSGNVTNSSAFYGGVVVTGTGTITNGYGLYITPFSSSGITNKWGVYVDDATAKNYLGGSLSIGTTSDYGYKLAVNGSAIFTEAKVKLFANWPDYVFHKDYNLIPLGEVDKFIQQNHHLPGMPSAEEVKENGGIELGDMSGKLLKKIEELTLYVIELKKENEKIKKQLQISVK